MSEPNQSPGSPRTFVVPEDHRDRNLPLIPLDPDLDHLHNHENHGKAVASKASFMDLPNELLEMIVEYLDDQDLYRLSHVCRVFNFIAMPRYIRENTFTSPSSTVFLVSKEMEILPALITSLSFTSTERLVCGFSRFDFGRNLNRLYRLILKLSSVKSADIDFSMVLSDDSLPQGWKIGPHLAEDLQTIFEAILARQCTSLAVKCKMYQRIPDDGSNSSLLAQPRRRVSWLSITRHFNPRACRRRRRVELSTRDTNVDFKPRHIQCDSLRTFKIRSSTLLVPPMRDWTLGVISSSHITKLHFDYVRLSTELWDDVLFAITLPSLYFLSLLNSGLGETVSVPTFFDFLERHPSIRILHCQGLHRPLETEGQKPLPHIEILESSPPYVVYFLESPDAPRGLQRICIKYLPYDYFDYTDINNALSAIGRLSREVELHIMLPKISSIAVATWLSFSIEAVGLDKDHLLGCVTTLGLKFPIKSSEELAETVKTMILRSLVSRWLGLFPALKCLRIDECMLPPKEAHHISTWIAIVRSIHEHCPTVTTIELAREEHDVSTWLTKDVFQQFRRDVYLEGSSSSDESDQSG